MLGDGKAEMQTVHQEGVIHRARRFETRLFSLALQLCTLQKGTTIMQSPEAFSPTRCQLSVCLRLIVSKSGTLLLAGNSPASEPFS
jgi:hypothetical protein